MEGRGDRGAERGGGGWCRRLGDGLWWRCRCSSQGQVAVAVGAALLLLSLSAGQDVLEGLRVAGEDWVEQRGPYTLPGRCEACGVIAE
ncbi:hypothetical protein E2C01_018388 [Portunus trituberculatus]|uniref:Uncharacterized protein n=1 Tax=Portunus trituberculatus TaxID=210409 RepID=A0A5B7DW98_PORTR|nr:hypothetical protein [Portunus trituberculatus]